MRETWFAKPQVTGHVRLPVGSGATMVAERAEAPGLRARE